MRVLWLFDRGKEEGGLYHLMRPDGQVLDVDGTRVDNAPKQAVAVALHRRSRFPISMRPLITGTLYECM